MKSYSRIPTDVYNIDVNTLLSSDARMQSTSSLSENVLDDILFLLVLQVYTSFNNRHMCV